jgi:hypothetical protein
MKTLYLSKTERMNVRASEHVKQWLQDAEPGHTDPYHLFLMLNDLRGAID